MAKHTGIRKLSNGRWRARFFAGCTNDGRRVYPARTFDTQREAIDWRAEQRFGRSPESAFGNRLTVALYLDQWLAQKHNIRENTRRAYRFAIESYIKPGLGRIKLTRLSPSQIEEWQAALLSRQLSKTTVSTTRTVLYGACKKAVKLGLIKSNPVAGTDGTGRSDVKLYHMTVDEALRLIDACEGERFGLLFELSLACGLRPEEAAGLTWADLDLTGTRGVLRVNRVVHWQTGGGWCWQPPKTKNSKRPIVFPAELVAKLVSHRKAQLEEKLKVGQYWQNNDLVFPTRIGTPARHCMLWNHLKKMVKRAGLPSAITLYSLRHAFVTLSLIAGVDPKTVSAEAGHYKVSFTLDRYGSVLDEMHETAADKREGLLKARGKK